MPIQPPPALKAGPFGTRGGMSLGPKPMNTKLPPPKLPPGLRVEHRIGIQAPAEVIWEVLADLPRWHEWCELYPKAAGQIRIGGVLDLTLALPGRSPEEIHPVVLEWVPNEQLHWRLTMLAGLVKTTRFFEIEALSAEGCIVNNGELIGGFLGPRVGKRMAGPIYRSFMAMNEAWKARAEGIWQARKDA